jgi:hypothetical protein
MTPRGQAHALEVARETTGLFLHWHEAHDLEAMTNVAQWCPSLVAPFEQLLAKLEKALRRRRVVATSDVVKLWTVTRAEAASGFAYLTIRFFSPLAEGLCEPPDRVLVASLVLWVELHRALAGSGRESMDEESARRLLDRYSRAPSSARTGIASGTQIRKARTTVTSSRQWYDGNGALELSSALQAAKRIGSRYLIALGEKLPVKTS